MSMSAASRKMGAEVEATETSIAARTVGLRGARIYMDYPSHTGTENLLMAAVLADGKTTIVNAACEPEIVALGNMLNRMGAQISGSGLARQIVDRRRRSDARRLRDDSAGSAGSRMLAIGAVITGGEVTLQRVREATCCR